MVQTGTTLEDVCKVTGNPLKSVQWLKDGKATNPSIPLTENEYGNYTLKADGHIFIEKNFTIHVLCKYLGNYILIFVAFKIRHAILSTLILIRLSNNFQKTL